MRAAAAVVLLLLAGCTDFGVSKTTLVYDHDGPAPIDGEGHVSCGDTTTLAVHLEADGGSVAVRVRDGDGKTVFSNIYEADDGGTLEHSLFGAPGTWTLRVDAVSYDGVLEATLSC